MTTVSPRVPVTLILEQGPMLHTLGRIFVKSVLPIGRPDENPSTFEPARITLPAPSSRLVASYAAWSGAADRYQGMLPPHLFSQWAMPAASRVLEQTRYQLASIINQGVSMRVNGPLPAGQPLQVTARMKSLEETDGRARVSVEISSGTEQQPDAVAATVHATFILSSQKKKSGGRTDEAQPQWTTVGQWRTTGDDGLRFALLTGDFNPIHWIGLAGKLSPFKRKVLHGFGMFVRSYEALAAEGAIKEIDVRFLRPVPLPSGELRVQQSPAEVDGWRALRLVGDNEQLHLAGRFRR